MSTPTDQSPRIYFGATPDYIEYANNLSNIHSEDITLYIEEGVEKILRLFNDRSTFSNENIGDLREQIQSFFNDLLTRHGIERYSVDKVEGNLEHLTSRIQYTLQGRDMELLSNVDWDRSKATPETILEEIRKRSNTEKAARKLSLEQLASDMVDANAEGCQPTPKEYVDDSLKTTPAPYGSERLTQAMIDANATEPSALGQAHIRQMVNYIEESISNSLQSYLFEPNSKETRASIAQEAYTILNNVEAQGDITDFTVVCDERNNPATAICDGRLNLEVTITPTGYNEMVYIPGTIQSEPYFGCHGDTEKMVEMLLGEYECKFTDAAEDAFARAMKGI